MAPVQHTTSSVVISKKCILHNEKHSTYGHFLKITSPTGFSPQDATFGQRASLCSTRKTPNTQKRPHTAPQQLLTPTLQTYTSGCLVWVQFRPPLDSPLDASLPCSNAHDPSLPPFPMGIVYKSDSVMLREPAHFFPNYKPQTQ